MIKKRREEESRIEDRDSTTHSKTSAGKKRKSKEGHASLEAPHKRSRRDFPEFESRTKRVPQEFIESKWKRLPDPEQRQVRELFLRAKRRAVNGIRDSRQRAEAEAAVGPVVRRLEKQLPRMPFPAAAKASDFNLDDIIARNRALEAEEAPLIHSCQLLKAEIEREEQRLTERRELLAQLEAIPDQEANSKGGALITHPLLRRFTKTSGVFDDADAVGFVSCLTDHSVLDAIELRPQT